MKKQLLSLSLAALALVGGPALATPERKVVAYDELMVLVPGLEALGYSRITTVEACAEVTEVADWTALTTDYELESMEVCLVEHT
jgi:hypothetical protein